MKRRLSQQMSKRLRIVSARVATEREAKERFQMWACGMKRKVCVILKKKTDGKMVTPGGKNESSSSESRKLPESGFREAARMRRG